jgi:hypothetical protein
MFLPACLRYLTVPHYGEESVLEEHGAGARGKVMKGALALFAQDAQTKLLLYTAADIQREEAHDQVLTFLSFWKRVRRGIKPTFIFDSKFTTYENLSKLNQPRVKFITLRRRGHKLMKDLDKVGSWKRITIVNEKRKYPTMIADTLYSRLAQNLRGFEACDAPKLYRDFVKGKGQVAVKDRQITVMYPRRAHNPILRAVPWQRLPQKVPWLDDAQISFHFQ